MAVSPQFVTSVPAALNLGAQLWILLPISNIGTVEATDVTVSGITLGATPLISPISFPVIEGALGAPGRLSVAATFDGSTLTVGQKELLTVRGTYVANGVVSGFALNQIVTVPGPPSPAITLLKVEVSVVVSGNTWNYTLKNSEPSSSTQYVSCISIDLAAPATVSGTPAGWSVDTDNATYVLWVTANPANQIAPGASLGGFQLTSSSGSSVATKAVINSWDQSTGAAGNVNFMRVTTPAP